jgi:hypothetical protein
MEEIAWSNNDTMAVKLSTTIGFLYIKWMPEKKTGTQN